MYTIFPPLDPTGYYSMNSMLFFHLFAAFLLCLDSLVQSFFGCFACTTVLVQVLCVYLEYRILGLEMTWYAAIIAQ